jgi:hypothetical protein
MGSCRPNSGPTRTSTWSEAVTTISCCRGCYNCTSTTHNLCDTVRNEEQRALLSCSTELPNECFQDRNFLKVLDSPLMPISFFLFHLFILKKFLSFRNCVLPPTEAQRSVTQRIIKLLIDSMNSSNITNTIPTLHRKLSVSNTNTNQ